MSLWQQMKALFVTPASMNLRSIPSKLTNASVKSPMECESPPVDPDTSQTVIQGLSQIRPCAQSIRCIYCHDVWTKGIRCDCGAVYHNECAGVICATLGCGRKLCQPINIKYPIGINYPINIEYGPIPKNVIDRLNNFTINPTYESLKDIL